MLKTPYEEIVNINKIGKQGKVDSDRLFKLGIQENLPPSDRDSVRCLMLFIDVQNDFIEGGALPVPGAIGDVERMTRFIYNNMEGITDIMYSMDTHYYPWHIFFPAWWENADGENPKEYTEITYDDVSRGIWRTVYDKSDRSLIYLQDLEKRAKKKLCIWPYHCIYGTNGHKLESEFAKMVTFYSVARKNIPQIIIKGTDSHSEMYGPFEGEDDGNKNVSILDTLQNYDKIFIAGEAASHCVMETVRQIGKRYATQPEITSKITVLKDCTSPIKGWEQRTKDAFDELERTYGIKFANSTDIQLV